MDDSKKGINSLVQQSQKHTQYIRFEKVDSFIDIDVLK